MAARARCLPAPVPPAVAGCAWLSGSGWRERASERSESPETSLGRRCAARRIQPTSQWRVSNLVALGRLPRARGPPSTRDRRLSPVKVAARRTHPRETLPPPFAFKTEHENLLSGLRISFLSSRVPFFPRLPSGLLFRDSPFFSLSFYSLSFFFSFIFNTTKRRSSAGRTFEKLTQQSIKSRLLFSSKLTRYSYISHFAVIQYYFLSQ